MMWFDRPWSKTGRTRFRRRFLLGKPRMMVEEWGFDFRPVVTGYSPMNWRRTWRWRWATPLERGQFLLDWLDHAAREAAEKIPMPPRKPALKGFAEMMTVRLISSTGTGMGSVRIPNEVVGPDTVRCDELIFIRKTHDLYVLATCCVASTG